MASKSSTSPITQSYYTCMHACRLRKRPTVERLYFLPRSAKIPKTNPPPCPQTRRGQYKCATKQEKRHQVHRTSSEPFAYGNTHASSCMLLLLLDARREYGLVRRGEETIFSFYCPFARHTLGCTVAKSSLFLARLLLVPKRDCFYFCIQQRSLPKTHQLCGQVCVF